MGGGIHINSGPPPSIMIMTLTLYLNGSFVCPCADSASGGGGIELCGYMSPSLRTPYSIHVDYGHLPFGVVELQLVGTLGGHRGGADQSSCQSNYLERI